MIRKKITTKQVSEITGLAESTIRGKKAGTHVLTRTKHGRSIRYYLDEAQAFAAGKPIIKRAVLKPALSV
jgi:hypothetical protein